MLTVLKECSQCLHCLKEAESVLSAVRSQWRVREADIESLRDTEEEELTCEDYTDKILFFSLYLLISLQTHQTYDGEQSHELIFAESQWLVTLCCCDHFVMMNFTHNINKLQWLLYTLMICNEQKSWISETHILTAWENSDIVTAELQTVSFSLLQCSLLIYYRLSSDVIIDGISAIYLLMTLSVSSLQFRRPF